MMRSVSYEQLRSALALWLPYVAVAAVCLAAGLGALALSLLRARDRLLLWTGVLAVLYGVRLLCENDLVRIAFGISSLRAVVAVLTYSITIPAAFFFRELLGRGWKFSIQVWLWAVIGFAPLAVLAGPVAGYEPQTELVNNMLVIAGTSLAVAHLFRERGSGPALLRYSILVFLVPALVTNLGMRIAGRNIEPFGFLILIVALAYTAARRAISREEQLIAVENELATARSIQASILPRTLPEMEGLRFAASYRPMTQVAGDFYDALRLDESRVAVFIADVSGHGVPAALIASMLKIAFAQQARFAADPACVLAGLNGILNGVLEGQFVTAACACIDLEAHSITYAGAGHPPALLVRRSAGDVMELSENGLLLGPFRNASYTNICIPFHRGDRLLLYTDGIVEAAASDGEPFGLERLRKFFAGQREMELAAVADAVIGTASAGVQEDDLTVLVAEAC